MEAKEDFESVFENYYSRIYNYAYTILLNRENAEDVVQDTFLAACMAYQSYDPTRASLSSWLTRIAHNKAINFVRSAAYRKETAMVDNYPEDEVSPTSDEHDTVLWLYGHLDIEEREFLDLRYVMGLSDKEVAALYNIEPKAVNKRYQRLLKRCRELLNSENLS